MRAKHPRALPNDNVKDVITPPVTVTALMNRPSMLLVLQRLTLTQIKPLRFVAVGVTGKVGHWCSP